VIFDASSSRSYRQPRDSWSGQGTGTPRASRMLPAAGGHSGSGTITSSPGSSSAWQMMNSAWMPAGRHHDFVGTADRDAVLRPQFLRQQLLQSRHPVVCR
jgi:hypothetical protein